MPDINQSSALALDLTAPLRIYTGAGFYAGMALLTQIEQLQKSKVALTDADFPALEVVFKNDLGVALNGDASSSGLPCSRPRIPAR
jgi:hypothetical protein